MDAKGKAGKEKGRVIPVYDALTRELTSTAPWAPTEGILEDSLARLPHRRVYKDEKDVHTRQWRSLPAQNVIEKHTGAGEGTGRRGMPSAPSTKPFLALTRALEGRYNPLVGALEDMHRRDPEGCPAECITPLGVYALGTVLTLLLDHKLDAMEKAEAPQSSKRAPSTDGPSMSKGRRSNKRARKS